MTVITVIDRPCGFGKTTDLIKKLKNLKKQNIKEKILIVAPELGEVDRYLTALGRDYFKTPIVDNLLVKHGYSDNKTDVLIDILSCGQNAIITHALYERIRQFEHLLTDYCVIIDEVPKVAKQVPTMFGSGVFKHLLHDKKYINIDPNTQLITATGNWVVDEHEYGEGSDIGISKFMATLQSADVYFIKNTYCVMPLPDAFFTKPKSLTILTFLFTGTQLDHYMKKRGYIYSLQTCINELAQFKKNMNANLKVFHKTTKIPTGYAAMTSKVDKNRKTVGYFIKNVMQLLNKNGLGFNPEMILVASSKDAWYGKELNAKSNVTNASSLMKLTRLGKASYTSMLTRGTNKFRDKSMLIMMGKLNLHPDVAGFLGMKTKVAKERYT